MTVTTSTDIRAQIDAIKAEKAAIKSTIKNLNDELHTKDQEQRELQARYEAALSGETFAAGAIPYMDQVAAAATAIGAIVRSRPKGMLATVTFPQWVALLEQSKILVSNEVLSDALERAEKIDGTIRRDFYFYNSENDEQFLDASEGEVDAWKETGEVVDNFTGEVVKIDASRMHSSWEALIWCGSAVNHAEPINA